MSSNLCSHAIMALTWLAHCIGLLLWFPSAKEFPHFMEWIQNMSLLGIWWQPQSVNWWFNKIYKMQQKRVSLLLVSAHISTSLIVSSAHTLVTRLCVLYQCHVTCQFFSSSSWLCGPDVLLHVRPFSKAGIHKTPNFTWKHVHVLSYKSTQFSPFGLWMCI